jgi:hypothetical protein
VEKLRTQARHQLAIRCAGLLGAVVTKIMNRF